MSLINFESERVSDKRREELRAAREKILQKEESKFYHQKAEEERRKQRGDDKWMVPSVENKIKEFSKSSKKSKKHKKEKKKKEKKKKKKHISGSSSSDSDDEEEWVEKSSGNTKVPASTSVEKDNKAQERDAWMIPTSDLSDLLQDCGDGQNVRGGGRGRRTADRDKVDLDKLGQSSRELNPYWKDGGTGLPEDKQMSCNRSVGDGGAEWLRRALRRAEEQAAEEGRSLEDVASERWGSLQHLKDMLAVAEERTAGGRRRSAFRRPAEDGGEPPSARDGRDIGSRQVSDSRERRQQRRMPEEPTRGFMRPDDSHGNNLGGPSGKKDTTWRISREKADPKSSYKHWSHSQSETKRVSVSESSAWKKADKSAVQDKAKEGRGTLQNADKEQRGKNMGKLASSSSSSGPPSESEEEKHTKAEADVRLTDLEMNELAAKLVKAEILGNEALVSQLRAKLDAARATRSAGSGRGGGSDAVEGMRREPAEEVVVLTRTDARGNMRPAVAPSFKLEDEQWGGRRGRKASKKKTHDSKGQRVQYFADDAKFSLQDLYQREKFVTAVDQQAEFVKLAAKGVEGEAAAMRGPSASTEHQRAVSDSRWVAKALEDCRWCLGGKRLSKHLIAALGEQVYLCVPPHTSLVDGHCLLIPSQHVPCSTQLDENVWEEMQRFRKGLVTMFMERDLDVVFFETAIHLKKLPHMVLECVPVPKEAGDLAPIYFKKAILECEMEWSMNKKVVDLDSGKTVRRAIPRGLPYFWVGFGNEDKFAHIIEDEKRFPKNFAQEVVGGMLEIDHMHWRKPRLENFDAQRQKVLQFAQWWKPHDFTRGSKRSHDSSSSSTSSESE